MLGAPHSQPPPHRREKHTPVGLVTSMAGCDDNDLWKFSVLRQARFDTRTRNVFYRFSTSNERRARRKTTQPGVGVASRRSGGRPTVGKTTLLPSSREAKAKAREEAVRRCGEVQPDSGTPRGNTGACRDATLDLRRGGDGISRLRTSFWRSVLPIWLWHFVRTCYP